MKSILAPSVLTALTILFPPCHSAANGAQREGEKPKPIAVGPQQVPGAAWYAPGPLYVEVDIPDGSYWATTTSGSGLKRFWWRPSANDLDGMAMWQLTSSPFPAHQSGVGQRGLLASGSIQIPQSGSSSSHRFQIDLSKYFPAQPPPHDEPATYYVRVMALTGTGRDVKPFKALTGNVELIYKQPPPFQFPTVKEANPDLYSSSPMTVAINLNELHIENENEGGDEPYLLLFVIFADGTTINPLDFTISTARIHYPVKVHGNVPDEDKHGNDLDSGTTALIPAATGKFVESIAPIGLELAADLQEVIQDASDPTTIGETMRENTKIYILAVAMEEDGTSDAAANAARNAARNALRHKVNDIIQSMSLADLKKGKTPEFDPGVIQDEIKSKVFDAAFDATLSGPWFLGPLLPFLLDDLDTDDYVGWNMRSFSYGQILDAGSDGIQFEMYLREAKTHAPTFYSSDLEGTYVLRGSIRRQ